MSLGREWPPNYLLFTMPRYTVSDEHGWSPFVLWRIRASVADESSGESMEFRSRALADEVAELLEKATQGERPTKPEDATPFAAYDLAHGVDGWIYLWYGDLGLSHKPVGRSRSEDLARRAADLLSAANARPRRNWRGPVKARFF